MWYRDPITIGVSSIPGGVGGAGKSAQLDRKCFEADKRSGWLPWWDSHGKIQVSVLAAHVDVWRRH